MCGVPNPSEPNQSQIFTDANSQQPTTLLKGKDMASSLSSIASEASSPVSSAPGISLPVPQTQQPQQQQSELRTPSISHSFHSSPRSYPDRGLSIKDMPSMPTIPSPQLAPSLNPAANFPGMASMLASLPSLDGAAGGSPPRAPVGYFPGHSLMVKQSQRGGGGSTSGDESDKSEAKAGDGSDVQM